MAFVSRGEAPLGIVYQTDTVTDKGVEIVGTFPASSHPPIIYPLAVTATSTNPGTASYIEFLRSSVVKPAVGLQGFVLLR
jgi:molybdate transport system substrate-binding protein